MTPLRALVLGLCLLPVLVWAAAAAGVDGVLLHSIEGFFAWQCRSAPQRSFELFGEPFRVCARCLGIYLGAGMGLSVLPSQRLSWRALAFALAFGTVVLALDVLTERVGLRPAFAPLRLLSGVLFAWPAGAAIRRGTAEWSAEKVPAVAASTPR